MTRKSEGPTRIVLSGERKEEIVCRLIELFRRDYDEDLSRFRAEDLLRFFMQRLGPAVYNQAIQDACAFMMERVQDLDATYLENEAPGPRDDEARAGKDRLGASRRGVRHRT